MNHTNINSKAVDPVLLSAPFQLNMWYGLFIFIAGNINCFGNVIVFSTRSFRYRACSVYLIAEAANNFIYFDFVLLTRMIQKGYRLPIINQYEAICKIRQFFSQYANQISFLFFILAALDRLLSTQRSLKYRQWSNRLSLAYKIVPLSMFLWFLGVGHRLILYSASTGKCIPQPGFYEKFDAYFEVVLSAIFPPIIVILLGYGLLRNVRHIVNRRIAPTTSTIQQSTAPTSSIEHIDSQITKMLFLQSVIATPTFLLFGVQVIYSSVTETWYKSPERLAWETIFIEFIRLSSYIFNGTSFYISFVTGRSFRRAIFRILGINRFENETGLTTGTRTHTTQAMRKYEPQPLH